MGNKAQEQNVQEQNANAATLVVEPPKASTPKRRRGDPAGEVLKAGVFVEMIDEVWFKCTDISAELNEHRSKIGLLVEDAEYDHSVGIPHRHCKTFTLRQYYRDGSPSVDYTPAKIEEMFKGWRRFGDAPEYYNRLERIVHAGIREFERQYSGVESEIGEQLDFESTLNIDERIERGLPGR